jgi:outer membrane lipoprotein-sorting protein
MKWVVACLVLLGFAASARADEAFEARLQAIDAVAARVQDFSARFEQAKHTALLRKPLLSSGTVKVLGATMRWDTAAPEPSVLLADGESFKMYYPRQSLLEVYPAQGAFRDLMTSPVPRLQTLRKNFALEPLAVESLKDDAGALLDGPDRVAVRLKPTSELLQKHVGEVRVLLDSRQAIMLCMVVVDADGDRTVIRLSDVRVNSGLKPTDLSLAIPQGVKISRPVEGGGR